jgi:hypothetical protein
VLGQAKLRPEQILRSGCAQAHDHLRTDGSNLRFEPGAAGRYFKRIWLFMQPNFTPWLPLEMLNRIGDINLSSVDTRQFEAPIQQLAGGPDEWFPLLILAITRLFPHHKNRGMGSPFAKNDLGRVLV